MFLKWLVKKSKRGKNQRPPLYGEQGKKPNIAHCNACLMLTKASSRLFAGYSIKQTFAFFVLEKCFLMLRKSFSLDTVSRALATHYSWDGIFLVHHRDDGCWWVLVNNCEDVVTTNLAYQIQYCTVIFFTDHHHTTHKTKFEKSSFFTFCWGFSSSFLSFSSQKHALKLCSYIYTVL